MNPAKAFLLLLAASGPAIAGYSIEPAKPTTSDFIRIRLDIEGPCDPTGGTVGVDLAQGRVVLTVAGSDVCDPGNPANTLSPRFFDVGRLPAGSYTVDYIGCGNAPPPVPPCQLFRTEPLAVLGLSGTRFTVPALSGPMMILLAFAVMALAAILPRRSE